MEAEEERLLVAELGKFVAPGSVGVGGVGSVDTGAVSRKMMRRADAHAPTFRRAAVPYLLVPRFMAGIGIEGRELVSVR